MKNTGKQKNLDKDNQSMLHNIDLEKTLLSSLVNLADSYDLHREILHTNLFCAYRHQVIFDTIKAMKEQTQQQIDLVALVDRLRNKHNLDTAGGEEYVCSVVSNAIYGISFKLDVIIARLEDLRVRRDYTKTLKNSLLLIKNMDESAIDIVNQTSDTLLNSTSSMSVTEYASQHELNKRLVAELQESLEGGGATKFKTGFADLDKQIHMSPGDLIIIAARPSMGKTTLALNIAENIAIQSQLPAVIFSIETPATQLQRKFISRNGKINVKKLYNVDSMTEANWSDFTFATQQLNTRKIMINDDRNITKSHIHAQCNKIRRENKSENLGCIVVDYLQIIQGFGTGTERTHQIGEVTRSLKSIAYECGCPIILLSQLNRGVESRHNKRPLMSDLRDSGSIEQDADIIMSVYRDDYYNENSKEPGIAEIAILKGRNTGTGVIRLVEDFAHCQFIDVAKAVA